jgi:hypothetical protein
VVLVGSDGMCLRYLEPLREWVTKTRRGMGSKSPSDVGASDGARISRQGGRLGKRALGEISLCGAEPVSSEFMGQQLPQSHLA